jgi:hypothetical protein
VLTGFADELGTSVAFQSNHVTTVTMGVNSYLNYNTKLQVNLQGDWFGDRLFTPTSRVDGVLRPAATFRSKVLARVQLFF